MVGAIRFVCSGLGRCLLVFGRIVLSVVCSAWKVFSAALLYMLEWTGCVFVCIFRCENIILCVVSVSVGVLVLTMFELKTIIVSVLCLLVSIYW